ncbi:MAG: hypothetical protein R3A51_14110 [Nannocystaceae bacterium]|nr:hypothetical protein [Myxococcales bacterium]
MSSGQRYGARRTTLTLILGFTCGLAVTACLKSNPVSDCNDAYFKIADAQRDCGVDPIIVDCAPWAEQPEGCDLSDYFRCLGDTVTCDGETPEALVVGDASACVIPDGCSAPGGVATDTDGDETDGTDTGGSTTDTTG